MRLEGSHPLLYEKPPQSGYVDIRDDAVHSPIYPSVYKLHLPGFRLSTG